MSYNNSSNLPPPTQSSTYSPIPPPAPPPQPVLQQHSHHHHHHQRPRYTLEVIQNPVRARMCGFGDKDRRQITPPPCIRLRMFDSITGFEIKDISNLDVSCFALSVELWSIDEAVNMSLVLPSGQVYNNDSDPVAASSSASIVPTKNLIGSLVATAFKLYDLNDEQGIWFIMQDLSIRTEGDFKLKFSFFNLCDAFNSNGTAQILCSTFSEPFRSYSAKKFPGVIDSTSLSKCFAIQGIRIPVRRDKKSRSKSITDEHQQPQYFDDGNNIHYTG